MNRLEIVNNISTNIERERIKLGMSQAQFAKALDMSLSTYKRIANGESSRIDVYTAYLIYKLTGRFSCELTGFNDDVINLVKRIKKLSKSQRILIDSIIDTELALSAYKDESCHTEDLISVLIPTGNMTDGMIFISKHTVKRHMHSIFEKLDVSNYRKAFGDAIHIGIRITSNHLHPVYNKGDILLISRNPIRDGDTGIFINAQNKRAYIRKLHQKNPCELTPINNYGETFYVDSDNVDDMSKWIKFGHVLCKVR